MIGIDRTPDQMPFRVLIVSAADVSRGPAVHRVLRTQLRTRRVEESIVLASAGLDATAGDPMHPHTVRALTEVSVDPRDHVAHRIGERRLAQADLVLTATRTQRPPVIAHREDLRERTFTVIEFARLVCELDPLPAEPDQLVAAVADARAAARPALAGSGDDLEDRSDGSFHDHERLVHEIDLVARDIVRALAGCLRTPPMTGVA